MVKFKRSKNRVSTPAEGIVVGGGVIEKPKKAPKPKMMKGSDVGNAASGSGNTSRLKLSGKPAFILLAALLVIGILSFWLYRRHQAQQPVRSKDIPTLTPEQAIQGVGAKPAGLP